MTYKIEGWSHDQQRLIPITVTDQQVWQWLKAERQHHGAVKVAENQRRKLGVRLPDDFRPTMNRADRRRWRRTWKRIK